MKVGDTFQHQAGIDATPIPVGAKVRHHTGVDQRTHEDLVVLVGGIKKLGDIGWAGYGPLTILSLPNEENK